MWERGTKNQSTIKSKKCRKIALRLINRGEKSGNKEWVGGLEKVD